MKKALLVLHYKKCVKCVGGITHPVFINKFPVNQTSVVAGEGEGLQKNKSVYGFLNQESFNKKE